jgi:hypothetical protein
MDSILGNAVIVQVVVWGFCVTGGALIAVLVWLATGVIANQKEESSKADKRADEFRGDIATLKALLQAEIHAHAIRLTSLEEWRKASEYMMKRPA